MGVTTMINGNCCIPGNWIANRRSLLESWSMKLERSLSLFISIFLLVVTISGFASAQAGRKAAAAPKKADQCELHEPIHEDLAAQVAKFKLVSMPFSVVGLSDQERQMVYKLVDASRQLELIYWHQSDPKGLELLKKMSGCNQVQNQKLRRFL